jgi:hypothetical protein
MDELCQELNKDAEKDDWNEVTNEFHLFFRKAAKLMVSDHGISSFL